jgi:hypothetical protein
VAFRTIAYVVFRYAHRGQTNIASQKNSLDIHPTGMPIRCLGGLPEDRGAPLPGLSPQALGDWQKAEIAKWWPMIKAANVKVE